MTPSEGPLRRVVPFEPRDGSAPIRSGGSIEASGPGASAPREPRGVPRLRRDRRSIEPAGRSRSSWVYAAVEFPERPDREPSPWPPWTLSSSPVSRTPDLRAKARRELARPRRLGESPIEWLLARPGEKPSPAGYAPRKFKVGFLGGGD